MAQFDNALASLPFASYVIGFIQNGYSRSFIAVARDHAHQPFVTYEIALDGSCTAGHYHDKRSVAMVDLLKRAGYV